MSLSRKQLIIISAALLAIVAAALLRVAYDDVPGLAGSNQYGDFFEWLVRTVMDKPSRAYARNIAITKIFGVSCCSLAERVFEDCCVACSACHGAPRG